jgi:AraC-like DNA-binding protein
MFLQTVKPSYALSNYIKCYWVIEANSYNHSERIIAGVDPQILFHYKLPFIDVQDNGHSEPQPQSTICGQVLTPRSVQTNSICGAIGVVFYPHTVNLLIPVSMYEISNQSYNAADVFKPLGEIEDKIREGKTVSERITILETFFLKQLLQVDLDNFKLMSWVVESINCSKGQIAVDAILKETKFSERQLERLFRSNIGVSPKKYCEFRKLHNAISLLNTSLSLTEIAYEAGYYDQAHFCKVFKRDTGYSPSQFLVQFADCI